MKLLRTRNTVLSSLMGGAIAAGMLLAVTLSAQQRPPQPPPRAGARVVDSQPPRRQPFSPDRRGMPGARGMAPPRIERNVGPAQRGMGGARGMQGMRGMPGVQNMQHMRGGRGGPGTPAAGLLGMRQQLGLSDDQVRRLEALRANTGVPRNEADMMRAQADLMDATRGDVNLNGARAALERINRIRVEEELAAIKSRQNMRDVLTPEQKTRLDTMRDNERGGARQRVGPEMRPDRRRNPRPNMRQDMRRELRPDMRRRPQAFASPASPTLLLQPQR
ncbi:MAG: Spy/CpxP family protein refolding chaperone [Gemmatimonas sp.]